MGIQRDEARHEGQNPPTIVPIRSTRAQPGAIWLPHGRSQSVRIEVYKPYPHVAQIMATFTSLTCCRRPRDSLKMGTCWNVYPFDRVRRSMGVSVCKVQPVPTGTYREVAK